MYGNETRDVSHFEDEVEQKACTKYEHGQNQTAVRRRQEQSYFLLGGKKAPTI